MQSCFLNSSTTSSSCHTWEKRQYQLMIQLRQWIDTTLIHQWLKLNIEDPECKIRCVYVPQCWSGFWWLQGQRSWLLHYCEPALGPVLWSTPTTLSYSHYKGPMPKRPGSDNWYKSLFYAKNVIKAVHHSKNKIRQTKKQLNVLHKCVSKCVARFSCVCHVQTFMGWYPATDDTNTTLPPLKENIN